MGINCLPDIYNEIDREQPTVSIDDFTPVEKMQNRLEVAKWSEFRKVDKKLFQKVEKMRKETIPELMQMIELDYKGKTSPIIFGGGQKQRNSTSVVGGGMGNLNGNPFGDDED